jgi:hypothetical protein
MVLPEPLKNAIYLIIKTMFEKALASATGMALRLW